MSFIANWLEQNVVVPDLRGWWRVSARAVQKYGPLYALWLAVGRLNQAVRDSDEAEAALQWHLARARERGDSCYCIYHAGDCPPGSHGDS